MARKAEFEICYDVNGVRKCEKCPRDSASESIYSKRFGSELFESYLEDVERFGTEKATSKIRQALESKGYSNISCKRIR
ncbi:hypothetical protein [Pseudomonas sp. AKS31]|uniref:hypothetical protein n=1 Tax=Pseudomonas sp. AKS31 TaxID=2949091 RepID=UPI002029C018|nr:hypothetical protein [Pseudomonas sp. AKS31]MCL9800021.1 hypothetical protein [Pseudomonas sp. AKS31]